MITGYPADPTTLPEYRADLAAKLRAAAIADLIGRQKDGLPPRRLTGRPRNRWVRGQDHDANYRDAMRDAGRGHLLP